jgi:hypothetical protein
MDMELSLVGMQQEFRPLWRYWFTTALGKEEAEPGTPAR